MLYIHTRFDLLLFRRFAPAGIPIHNKRRRRTSNHFIVKTLNTNCQRVTFLWTFRSYVQRLYICKLLHSIAGVDEADSSYSGGCRSNEKQYATQYIILSDSYKNLRYLRNYWRVLEIFFYITLKSLYKSIHNMKNMYFHGFLFLSFLSFYFFER